MAGVHTHALPSTQPPKGAAVPSVTPLSTGPAALDGALPWGAFLMGLAFCLLRVRGGSLHTCKDAGVERRFTG